MIEQKEFGSPSYNSPIIRPMHTATKKSTIRKSNIFSFVGKLSLKIEPDDYQRTDKFFYSILSPKKIKPFE
jgi:hypothetical protein